MKRAVAALLCATMIATLLVVSGCAPSTESGDPAATQQRRLRVSGSGTCLPLIRILTEAYRSDDVEFVYLPGLHSGGGIKGVTNGDLEIGTVSRELTVEEKALELEYVKLSDDGLVMAVHPSVSIDGLTSQQVRDIYLGKYDNWNELGGPDLPMVILDRNEDESAKIILREYVLGPDLEITNKAINLFYESDMVDGLERTPGAVGYFSLGFGRSEDIPVRYLRLDGVEASVENIQNGTYKMVRPLGVVVEKPVSPEIAAFLSWAQGDDAVDLMISRGFAPPLPTMGE